MKKCRKCGKVQEEIQFRPLKGCIKRTICLSCEREGKKQRYTKSKKALLEYDKIYREKNKDLLRGKRRKRTGAKPRVSQ